MHRTLVLSLNSMQESPHRLPAGDIKSSGLPVLLFIHGDSFDWGSGNLRDGAVMAAHSDTVVVTINYRLGVLGKWIALDIYSSSS